MSACQLTKEMVSIVGRNGAGKSTFSKLVCGFEDPIPERFCSMERSVKGEYPSPCEIYRICYAESKSDDFEDDDL